MDTYRDYITGSLAEFTIAKEQYAPRSGWFSDRSATYLASGRPVVTSETDSATTSHRRRPVAFNDLDEALARATRCSPTLSDTARPP